MLDIFDVKKIETECGVELNIITYSNYKVKKIEVTDCGITEDVRIGFEEYDTFSYEDIKLIIENLKTKIKENINTGVQSNKEQIENYVKERVRSEFDVIEDYNQKLKKREEIIKDTVTKFNILDIELFEFFIK